MTRICGFVAQVLYKGGDMDSMCYGCVCSLAGDKTLLPAYDDRFGGTGYCDAFKADVKVLFPRLNRPRSAAATAALCLPIESARASLSSVCVLRFAGR